MAMSSEMTTSAFGFATARPRLTYRHWLSSWWVGASMVLVLVAVLWAPRLRGPIDLRYDAGVYYLLGTSLATGQGYRILSEPGKPTGIQYPPGLPAMVAVHQWALGTSDVTVVAPWLRRTYALLFLGLGLATLTLSRWIAGPIVGLLATGFSLVQVNTYLLSDMLFTELPFTLLSVVFALWLMSPWLKSHPFWRESGGFVLAGAGFMLRTAGLALLAAWVIEALLDRRWKTAGLRLVLGAVPFLAWQGHVAHVQGSEEYQQPVYQYQRAPYQYYNVSYATNLALIDPFKPELGYLDARSTIGRFAANLRVLPTSVGQAVTEPIGFWAAGFNALRGQDTQPGAHPSPAFQIPLFAWAALTSLGVIVLGARRSTFVVVFVLASIGLVMSTPWPTQFMRYLAPLSPFLALAAVMGAEAVVQYCWRSHARIGRIAATTSIGTLLLATTSVQAYTVWNSFLVRHFTRPVEPEKGSRWVQPKWFYHDHTWADWSGAVEWIRENTPNDAIIGTDAPHLCYLRTGRLSVMPPMESDRTKALQLVENVPISYVIIDELAFLDVDRRYALPMIEAAPAHWKQVYAHNQTFIYQRVAPRDAVRSEDAMTAGM
jgi:hypothetical protein